MSTSVMYHDRFQTYLQAIDDFCLMDDGFAVAVFKDIQSLELVLSVIFDQLLSLLSATVQYHLKNLHNSLADANISFPMHQWKHIPPVSVIFITERDILKEKKPIYHIRRRIDETGSLFHDDTEIIYVNSSKQNEIP